ncbi:uncharacterized protein LOC111923616 isoform X1 [Cyanistes caeruleus]|uniref:uncharacterized protein LOC111923616 isoform X1 n=1 Tax=Cyanistes caeruleus TaxID=156563 RepID=UPI000CDA8861|nr:uncharacterized protein LOC111923616 isoform X1 [Cyanistes caeruleus]XP_023775204.1 uncharacterized protein LOC111923616 isoform X1 [Cyanistes caeruleus]
MEQNDAASFTSPTGEKELDKQAEEISVFLENLLKQQRVLCSEDIKNLQVCLQEPFRRLKEKNEKLIKEKNRLSEARELVLQQEKILKDIKIKLDNLHKHFKRSELLGSKKSKELQIPIETLGAESRQREEKMKKNTQDKRQEREVYNSPSSPTQKIAVVKQTQKSSYLKNFCFFLGNSVWLLVRYLLSCVCLCLTLLLVYNHLPDPTWAYQLDILDSICHQPWTH